MFVKFREAEATDDSHATLSGKADEHSVPAGAALSVGLTDDGSTGVGVFIYRSAAGIGANNFKGIKLRWMHPPSAFASSTAPGATADKSLGSSGAASGERTDPSKAECKVYALPMVYVPEGAFASRSPWGHPLKIITTPDARKPEGHLDSDPSTAPYFAEWPNGYSAFYCMKYSISQGQYADFLNSIPSGKFNKGRYGLLAHNNFRRFSNKTYNILGHTITTNEAGVFRADVPDRFCRLMSNPDILSFTAWAGLRPPTNLEYEKACRGPRAVVRGADAWAPATCAPAAALDKSVLDASTAAGVGPSYWGIRELSLSGCIQEWPCVFQREPAVVKKNKQKTNNKDSEKSEIDEEKLIQQDEDKQKREYRGGHGSGSPEAPANWPSTFFGDWYYGGIWRLWGYGTVAQWVDPAEIGHFKWDPVDGCRTGRYGARAVRTAPPLEDKESLLDMDPPPDMAGCDVGLVYLSGRFKNTDNKPTKLDMSVKIPDACFLDGVASRTFTAAPKEVTPFRVRTVLTSQTAKDAVRRDAMIPVQIQAAGGNMLAEQLFRAPMVSLVSPKPPVINSYEGGTLTLRLTNAIDRMSTVVIKMLPSAGIYLPATERRVDLAAGAESKVSFPVPPQNFPRDGVWRIPYRITVAGGAPQDGVAVVNLLNQSRWWVSRVVQAGPKVGSDDNPLAGESAGGDVDDIGIGSEAFVVNRPPKDWVETIYGASAVKNGIHGMNIGFSALDPLPSLGSSVTAATRVTAPQDVDVVIGVQHALASLVVRVWVNSQVVYDSRSYTKQAKGKDSATSFRIRKGVNTMVVQAKSDVNKPVSLVDIVVRFQNAKDDKAIDNLTFDIRRK